MLQSSANDLAAVDFPGWSAGARGSADELEPTPIRAEWILEGAPTARSRIVSRSSDGLGFTALWDCSAGRFHWFYGVDESICILDGSVVLTDAGGAARRLLRGDTFLFPAGSHYTWNVPEYVRKVAFIHEPMSRRLRLVRQLFISIRRVLNVVTAGSAARRRAMQPASDGRSL
jgi:hypothetical protein